MSILDLIRRIATEPQEIKSDVTDEVWIRKDGKLVRLEVTDDEDSEKGQ